ncbi:MAG: twin-arginine translocase subunit TatC [Leadbetterella sp.]
MPLDQSKYIDYDDEIEENEGPENEMTFIEHLEELRWHIIRSVSAILIFMVLAFVYIEEFYNIVLLGPSRTSFWTYQMMCNLGKRVNIPSLCVEKLDFSLMSREVAGQFMSALSSSAIAGLVIAFPYVFWEVWGFIKPGLKITEKRAATGAIFYVTLLFFLGILFGYFIVTPFSISFLVNFKLDASIENQFDIGSYISILVTLTLACGLAFQLPMIMFVLAKIGIVTPQFLRIYRRHAIVVLLVVAAIITPSPDMFSQVIVAIPLYVLYELSILVAQRVVAAKQREEAL